MKKLTTEEFVERAREKHGNKYNYSETEYLGNHLPVKIICPEHGPFYQRPGNHLSKKYGCNLCSPTGGAKLTQKQFLDKCIEKHGYKYDYSETIFTGVKNYIVIICKMHGRFEQLAESHFKQGCSACAGNQKLTAEQFISRAKEVHGDKYDYSKVDYKSMDATVKIICPTHKAWMQTPSNHLAGKGCKYCSVGNTSKKEQYWLDSLLVPDDIQHRNVNIWIDNKRYCVDGYLPEAKIVYEFLGDFWHGNPSVFNSDDTNNVVHKKYGDLFNKIVCKIQELRKAGFKVISIWESKYDNINYRRKSVKGTTYSRISR
jgi:G:T-mismatch repair DNA endonuclease (very short patch repair protein)